jgi:hypothetical protein
MIHKHTLGFWEGHVAYPLEQHVIDSLWQHYYPDVQHGIIVNITYNVDSSLSWASELIRTNPVEAVLFTNLVDALSNSTHEKLCQFQNEFSAVDMQLVGYSQYYFPKYDYLDFWALFMQQHFNDYQDDQLFYQYKPKQHNKVFLCYNRKPHSHRVQLYESLRGQAPECRDVTWLGTATLGNVNNTHEHGDLGDDSYGIKAAATALGNMDVWRQSFLTIVAETSADERAYTPFITEKTYKSILGLRPFVIYGDAGIEKYLVSNGYRTFSHRLGMSENFDYVKMNQIILELSEQNLDELYQEWLPDIMHNRDNFYAHCARIKHRFGISALDKTS